MVPQEETTETDSKRRRSVRSRRELGSTGGRRVVLLEASSPQVGPTDTFRPLVRRATNKEARARPRPTRLSPSDPVSDLGARRRDGRLHPRQVPRRRPRPRAFPRQPPRDPRRRGGASRVVPDDVRDGGRTCREAVERAPTARAVLTQRERKDLPREMMPLAVASAEGDVEALEWLIQLFDGKGPEWRQYDYGGELSLLAAGRGKIAILAFLCARGYKLHVSACAYAAQEGTWRRSSGRVGTGARGTNTRAWSPRREGIWKCSGGRVGTGARGTSARARTRLGEATWRCFSGCTNTGVRGTRGRARRRRTEVTWRRCGGRARTGAREQYTCWSARGEATWRCCSGRVRTGARGTRRRPRSWRGEATWMCFSGRVRTGARGTS